MPFAYLLASSVTEVMENGGLEWNMMHHIAGLEIQHDQATCRVAPCC